MKMVDLLSGSCIAPLTPEQQSAVSDNLGNALNAVTSNTMVRNAVVNSLGYQVSGILGALL